MGLLLTLIAGAALYLSLTVSAAQLRINCGGNALPDIGFIGDQWYRDKGSSELRGEKEVSAPGAWRPVYDSASTSAFDFEYKIPLISGNYSVSLLFAETNHTAAGKRVQAIKVGGRFVASNFDIFSAAGGSNKGYILNAGHTTVGGDQILRIEVTSEGPGKPLLSGIVIDGNRPNALTNCDIGKDSFAFNMNMGGKADTLLNYAYENTDYIPEPIGLITGHLSWSKHWYSMLRTERYTTSKDLTVRIPVMDEGLHAYTVTTVHAEAYFDAPGKRLFDILINGKVERSKVDVVALTADSSNKVYEARFTRVSPVNGTITVTFRKVLQNPFVNGIRIFGYGADRIAVGGDCGMGK